MTRCSRDTSADPKIMVSWPRCAPRGLRSGSESDRVAEGFESSNMATLLGRGVDVSVVVVGSQVLIAGVWVR